MKIISWNVNEIRAIQKMDFIASMEKMSPDVLCLQETKAPQQEVRSNRSVEGTEGLPTNFQFGR